MQRTAFGKRTEGVDLERLVLVDTRLAEGGTLTRPQLGKLLADEWPGYEPQALAWSFQYLRPVVHPPPDGLWGRRGGQTPFALPEDWIGRSPVSGTEPAEFVRRYLAAFGPASIRDAQAWSGLTKLKPIFEKLRPELATFAGPDGQELFDVPDAPRPPAENQPPIRYLPPFDNLLLAYADRSRVMSPEIQARVCVGAAVAATFLLNGMVHGVWSLIRQDNSAVLRVDLFRSLSEVDCVHAEEEGRRLLAFIAPDATTHRFETSRIGPALE